jgi:uroporphyrinogen-III synthase
MNNHDFNLVNQLVQEQKSLWRIENHYITESKNKDEEKFWKKMKTQKTKAVVEISAMMKKSLL